MKVIYCGDIIFTQLADPVYEELKNGCRAFSNLIFEPRSLIVDGDPDEIPQALRSAFVLEGPATLQENFLVHRNITYSLSEIEEILTEWKETFFDVSVHYRCTVLF